MTDPRRGRRLGIAERGGVWPNRHRGGEIGPEQLSRGNWIEQSYKQVKDEPGWADFQAARPEAAASRRLAAAPVHHRDGFRATLDRVRRRGWSVGLGNEMHPQGR